MTYEEYLIEENLKEAADGFLSTPGYKLYASDPEHRVAVATRVLLDILNWHRDEAKTCAADAKIMITGDENDRYNGIKLYYKSEFHEESAAKILETLDKLL